MKILIIGFGSIGARHFEVLSGLYPGADISIVSAHSEHKNVKFDVLDKVPDLGSYDYYVIASETSLHVEQLRRIDAAAHGKKILVEKPLYKKPSDFKPANNEVFVGYNLRYHPLVEYVRNVKSRVLSVSVYTGQYLPGWRPGTDYSKSYSASHERGGGVLLDLSHEIDYVHNLFGEINVLGAVGGRISDLRINTEDYASFVGLTSRGVAVSITVEYLSRVPTRAMHIITVEGTYIADFIKGTMTLKTDDMRESEVLAMGCERNITYSKMHQDIIEGNRIRACSYDEGHVVLKVVSKIKDLMGWEKHEA